MSSGGFGQFSYMDVAKAVGGLTLLPIVVPFALICSFFVEHEKHRHWRRVASDATVRWSQRVTTIGLVQGLAGSSIRSYEKWCSKNGLTAVIDDVEGSDQKVMWLGDRNAECVLLYCHGGGFVYPIGPPQLYFWDYIQTQVTSKGLSISVAIVQYGLIPASTFPSQLTHATLALTHILKTHSPSKVLLVGESAGGNIVSQLLSHALHPIPSLPKYPVSPGNKLLGALMISPYVSFAHISPESARADILAPSYLNACSGLYTSTLPNRYPPAAYRFYFEPYNAPTNWFAGTTDRLVSRVLITSGACECIADDVVVFAHRMKEANPGDGKVEAFVEKNGKHAEPVMEFCTVRKRGDVPPRLSEAEGVRKVTEWIYTCCLDSRLSFERSPV